MLSSINLDSLLQKILVFTLSIMSEGLKKRSLSRLPLACLWQFQTQTFTGCKILFHMTSSPLKKLVRAHRLNLITAQIFGRFWLHESESNLHSWEERWGPKIVTKWAENPRTHLTFIYSCCMRHNSSRISIYARFIPWLMAQIYLKCRGSACHYTNVTPMTWTHNILTSHNPNP
jgi:hypothetical protein